MHTYNFIFVDLKHKYFDAESQKQIHFCVEIFL